MNSRMKLAVLVRGSLTASLIFTMLGWFKVVSMKYSLLIFSFRIGLSALMATFCLFLMSMPSKTREYFPLPILERIS